MSATVGLVNHMMHQGGSDPPQEQKHWEYTGEIDWGLFRDGLIMMGSGGAMISGGLITTKVGIGVFGIMYGSMSVGFGIGQSIKALQGYRPSAPLNFPAVVERGFGGSGMYGTALDGVINFSYSTTNLERAYHGFNTIRNIQSLRAVNPPPTYQHHFNHSMVPVSTRVHVPLIPN